MKAMIYSGNRRIELTDAPVPALNDGEVLVRVCCSALCGSERPDFEQSDDHKQDFVGKPALNTGHE